MWEEDYVIEWGRLVCERVGISSMLESEGQQYVAE